MDVIQIFDGLFAILSGRAAEITAVFQPIGFGLTTTLATLAVLFFGAAIWFGTSEWLSGLLRMCAMCAGTAWAITAWPELVQGTLAWVDHLIASTIPGWHGPAALFSMAIDLAGRLEVEAISAMWAAGPAGNALAGIWNGAALFVVVGLSIPGLLLLWAKLEMLLGMALAPLVLPALAFGLTAKMGLAPVRYLVTGSVRLVALAITGAIMARAITASLAVPGIDVALTNEAGWVLVLLALLTGVVGWQVDVLARQLVGGALESIDAGSFAAGMRGLALPVGRSAAQPGAGRAAPALAAGVVPGSALISPPGGGGAAGCGVPVSCGGGGGSGGSGAFVGL